LRVYDELRAPRSESRKGRSFVGAREKAANHSIDRVPLDEFCQTAVGLADDEENLLSVRGERDAQICQTLPNKLPPVRPHRSGMVTILAKPPWLDAIHAEKAFRLCRREQCGIVVDTKIFGQPVKSLVHWSSNRELTLL
jgi:hypothetical protein